MLLESNEKVYIEVFLYLDKMSRLEKITEDEFKDNPNRITSIFPIATITLLSTLFSYLGIVRANSSDPIKEPVKTDSTCYFGNVIQNITGDSLQDVIIELNNVTQGQKSNTITDMNGDYNLCILVGIEENPVNKSTAFGIRNAPNPFSRTIFSLGLPKESKVSLEIYDVSGRLVKTLIDNNLSEGQHRYVWDGKDNSGRKVSDGNYFYRTTVGTRVKTGKLVLIESANNSPTKTNLIVDPNYKSNLVKPDEVNLISSLPSDSIVFSAMDTLRFYSWIRANPPAGQNDLTMITLDQDSTTLRDKLEHLKHSFGLLDQDSVFDHKLVRWLDQHMPINVYSNPTAAIPYDTLVPILIAQATSNWETKSGLDSLFTVNNDSLPAGIGIIFEYPDSIPGANGVTVIDQWGYFPLHPLHVRIQIDKTHLARYDSFPDAILATFVHELGHGLVMGHSSFINEVMNFIPWVVEPSRQEGNIVRETYTLIKPGYFMGPYRFRGDLNPGPT